MTHDPWTDLSEEELYQAVLAELPGDAWLAASYLVNGRTMKYQEWGVQNYRKLHGASLDIVADRLRAIGRLKRHVTDPRPWAGEELREARAGAKYTLRPPHQGDEGPASHDD